MASRTSIENAALEITKLFTKAQAAVIALITRNATKRTPVSEQYMAGAVISILNNLEKKAYPLIKKDIEWHYVTSAKEASNTVKSITGTTVAKGLTAQDYLNIETLTRKSLNDYGESIKGAFSSSLKVMNEARKARIDAMFSPEGLSELNLRELKKKITEDIAKDFTGIVDKSGRRWELDTYAEMLSRTRMREVSDTAMAMRLVEEGYDLVVVSDHNTDCELCGPWENEVLSLTGDSVGKTIGGKKIRYSVDDARNAGFEHPNCKHRLLPWHSGISSD